MRVLEFSRCAFSISLAAALLCACGGSSLPIRASDSLTGNAGASGNKTFKYTGKKQEFVVPSGVTQLTVVARGAEGGGFAYYPSSNTPGLGGRVYAVIGVHPGEKLYVFVGGSGLHGGFNGGGAGGSSGSKHATANPGGGASDVRMGGDTLQDRIIVAAGGGGAGVALYTYGTSYGGKGGGLTGQSGGGSGSHSGGGGGGGTPSAGGSGGAGGGSSGTYEYPGEPGATGTSGHGGAGGNSTSGLYAGGGGGGGGGYYGGGGGGGGGFFIYSRHYESSEGGGGGGGSSYVEANAITSHTWTGWKKANSDGQVVFSWK
jgi:hypothetical protein